MSMRSAASCCQPRQERAVPRGARIVMRGDDSEETTPRRPRGPALISGPEPEHEHEMGTESEGYDGLFLHSQSRQWCSAQVPQHSWTRLRMAWRARWTRTAALPGVMPISVAKLETLSPFMSTLRRACAYSGFSVPSRSSTQAQTVFISSWSVGSVGWAATAC